MIIVIIGGGICLLVIILVKTRTRINGMGIFYIRNIIFLLCKLPAVYDSAGNSVYNFFL